MLCSVDQQQRFVVHKRRMESQISGIKHEMHETMNEYEKEKQHKAKKIKILTHTFDFRPEKELSKTDQNTETTGHCRKCNLHYCN